jgi:DNA-directed RNA polymerase subunit D
MVYSSDLKGDSDVVPVSGNIPIVKLGPSQKLKLELYAKLGRGLEHAKWQPVSACAYKYLPKVTVNPDNLENPEQVIQICPTNVFVPDPDSRIAVRDELACTLCMDCVERATPIDPKKPFPIKIEGDENSFLFNIESTGCLPPRRIVTEASKILGKKATILTDLVKKGLE